MGKLLTRTETAERLNVSPMTVRRLAKRGHLTEVRVSERVVRIPEESAETLATYGLSTEPEDAA